MSEPDREIAAMEAIVRAVDGLSEYVRARVLRRSYERYGTTADQTTGSRVAEMTDHGSESE